MKLNITLLMIIAMGILSSEAFAYKLVYGPYAEAGEWEVETTGVYDIDHTKTKNAVQEYHWNIGHGVNSFWHTELQFEAERFPKDVSVSAIQATHMEWENIFQLAPQGEYWLDPGLYLAYEVPVHTKQVGKFEAKILLEKDFHNFSHRLNLSLNKEVGGSAGSPHLDGGMSWSSRFRLSPYFQPGFEYWNDFSVISHQLDYNQQNHQVGPCFYGRLFNHVNYNIGYLFGVSHAAPRGEIKWILEYEF